MEKLPDINVYEVPISEINKVSSSGEYLINGFSKKINQRKIFQKQNNQERY